MIYQSTLTNRLLSRLPADDYLLLSNLLKPMACPIYMNFATADQPMDSVFFLETGIASVVVASPEGQSVEGALLGAKASFRPLPSSARIEVRISFRRKSKGPPITSLGSL